MPDSGYVHSLFSSIAERYVLANHVLSMGMDILWRLRVLEYVSEWRPAHLLDVATGTGDLALSIKREFPEIDIVGTDFCESMLQIARRRGLEQTFCADAMQLPVEDGRFDVVTVAFGLRNMENYASALQEFRRVLSPGGHLLILDFSMPRGIVLGTYRLYLHRILPLMAGWLTSRKEAYAYLGQSIEQFPREEKMLQLLRDTGYLNPTSLPLCGGIAAIYTAEQSCEPNATSVTG